MSPTLTDIIFLITLSTALFQGETQSTSWCERETIVSFYPLPSNRTDTIMPKECSRCQGGCTCGDNCRCGANCVKCPTASSEGETCKCSATPGVCSCGSNCKCGANCICKASACCK